MLTCKSPRKVMRVAYHLACHCLPAYSSKFSRKDFTLPQLFACLAVKELLKRSYRGAEAVLAGRDPWLRHPQDHNPLHDPSSFRLKRCRVDNLLDAAARGAAVARLLGLSLKPLAVD